MPDQSANADTTTAGDDVALVGAVDEIALREMRHLVRGLLAGRAGVVIEDAVLITVELVANARRHGSPPSVCRMALRDGGRRFRADVDDTAAGPPRIRPLDTSGGHGMLIVDILATACGVMRRSGHKTLRPNWRWTAEGTATVALTLPSHLPWTTGSTTAHDPLHSVGMRPRAGR